MITLRAHAVHLDGAENQVRATLGDAGGTFGRGSTCDLVLPDPERRISRLQGQMETTNGQYSVRNASTSNPMYVNGAEIAPGSSQPLAAGDELRAGSYVIIVEQIGAPDGTQPAAADTGPGPSPPAAADPECSENAAWNTAGVPTADPTPARAQPIGAANLDAPPDAAAPARANGFATMLASRDPLAVIPPHFLATHAGAGAQAQTRASAPADPGGSTAAGAADPANPFGDLLAGALPIGDADGPCGEALAEQGGPGALANHDRAIRGPGSAEQQNHAPAGTTPRHPVNPLAPDAYGAMPAVAPAQAVSLADPPAFSDDPFGDLMGAPITSQMARLGTDAASGPGGNYIPDDFNPLAVGGVAQRNTADPLSPLGLDARGLPDVQPQADIDSLYATAGESPMALVHDALREVPDPTLDVGISLDPLKLFGAADSGILPSMQPAGSNTSDRVSEMGTFFRVPVAIPEDPAPPARAPNPTQTGSAPIVPTVIPQDSAATPHDTKDCDQSADPIDADAPATRDPEKPTAAQGTASRVGDRDEDDTQTQDEAAFATTLPPQQNAANNGAEHANPDTASARVLLQAFKRGAGVEHLQNLPATPETMEWLGQLLQIAVQGAVSLLAARAAIKQEVRMPVTLINPKANNPLKFLPDGHTALLQMLGPRMPGFMPAIAAMQEAFDDLLRHESGLAAGTQATIEALFQRFDPVRLESRDRPRTMGERASRTVRDAHLWRAWVREYESLREEIQDDFFRRLGGDFQDAYDNEHGHEDDAARRFRDV